MKIYLAGTYSRPFVIEENMKVYIAISDIGYKRNGDYDNILTQNKPYILESFFYVKEQHSWMERLLPMTNEFLLDSGAFSFFGKSEKNMDWKKYVSEYCQFINKYQINNFVELDIEKITSMQEVEYLRKLIQDKTGKNPIQVWRPSRGLEYWRKMITENDYVAISASGQFDSAWTRKPGAENVLISLLKEAKNNNCKVHGLGYTNLKTLDKVPFYSVDSTAWLYGNRGGYLYQFNGKSIDKIQPKGMRLKGRVAAIHNFNEWVKFQKYAENNF